MAVTDEDVTNSHLRGSVLLVVGRVLAILVNFSIQIVTVRYLPKADYGILAFALSISSVLAVLMSFAMDKAAQRFLPVYLQAQDYRRFWGMLLLMFATVLGLGCLGIVIFASSFGLGWQLLSNDSRTQLVLVIIAALAVCHALEALFISLFAVLAKPVAIFVRTYLLGPFLRLTVAVVVVATGGDVFAFATGLLMAGVVGVVVGLSLLARIVKQEANLRAGGLQRLAFPLRQLYGYSATLLSGDLAFLLRGALVPIVLGVVFFPVEVAAYEAAASLARLNEFVLLTFAILFLPQAAKLAAVARHVELQALYEKTTVWTSVLSFPVLAVCIMTSSFLPAYVFGEQYRSSGNVLSWLALGYYAHACFGTNLWLLRATGNLRTLLAGDLMLISLTLALVLVLVPRHGAAGGSWAVCGTYLSQSIIYQVMVARTTRVNPFTRRCWAPFVGGVTLCLVGESLARSMDGGAAARIAATMLISTTVFVVFGRELDLRGTFPELARLPVVRGWVRSASAEDASRESMRT